MAVALCFVRPGLTVWVSPVTIVRGIRR